MDRDRTHALMEIPRSYLDRAENFGKIFQFLYDHVNHGMSALNMAVCQPGWAPAGDLIVAFPRGSMHQQVDRARFIFERDEGNGSTTWKIRKG